MFSWQWRLAARVATWSLCGGLACALLWSGSAFVLLSALHIYDPTSFAEGDTPLYDEFEFTCFAVCTVLALWFVPRGLLLGALCGFYAPASQRNPFYSRFFGRVVREVSLLGIARFFVALFCSAIFFSFVGFLEGAGCFLTLEIIGFGLTLWRALNRALQAEKPRISATQLTQS